MLHTTVHGPITRLVMARTVLGRPLYTVAAYLAGPLLVDTGLPGTAGELLAWLRTSGAADRLEAVVLTHHHEDHAGGAALLAEQLELSILAPPATAERLAVRRRIPLYRTLTWGTPRPCPGIAPLGERLWVGELELEVIPTPGHAFDHVVLFDRRRRWLFSGDLYVHEKVRYVRRIEDPWQHLESLDRAIALDPQRLFCAHGGVVDDARRALERKAAWWRDLADRARELAAQGLSVRAVTRRLLGREGPMCYLSLGDFSQRNLIAKLAPGGSPRGLSRVDHRRQ